MKKEVIDKEKGKLWLEEDNIVFILFKKRSEVDVDDIKDMQKASVKLVGGKPYALCSDIRGIKSLSKEARDFAGIKGNPDAPFAVAMIIGSPISRFFGNLFARVSSPPFPTKLFTEKEKAMEWLKQTVDS